MKPPISDVRLGLREPTFNADLLKGIDALKNPDYDALNKTDGRNDRLLYAVLCAYAKHHLDNEDIGWHELGDILGWAITNEIGDDAYQRWIEEMKGDAEETK